MYMRQYRQLALVSIAMLLLLLSACGNANKEEEQEPADLSLGYKQWTKSPKMVIDAEKTYQATVKTNKGSFTIELFPKEAPLAVNNFVFLSREGFYDGIIFHRVISDFMIQAGDPTGTGYGGPGYKFKHEKNPHRYARGIVAMANSGPNTNGSQFFVCTGTDCGGLNANPDYTKFGKVIEGLDVVMLIDQTPVGANDRPKEEIVIESIEIVEK